MAKMQELTENIQLPGERVVLDSVITWIGVRSGLNDKSDREYIYPHTLECDSYIRRGYWRSPVSEDTSFVDDELLNNDIGDIDRSRIISDILENIQDGEHN